MFDTSGMDQNFELVLFGIENFQVNGATQQRAEVIKFWNTSSVQWNFRRTSGTTSTNCIETSNSTDDVFVLRMRDPMHVEIYTGASSAGAFPAAADLLFRGYVLWADLQSYGVSKIKGKADLAFIFAAAPVNTNNSFRVWLKKFLIETR